MAWAEALGRYGTMSLGDVFEPAIELAEEGFVVTERDAEAFARAVRKLQKFPTSAAIFLPGGRPPIEGQLLRQRELAASFRKIARDGAETFYQGELADKITRFLQANGGLLTKEDFASWKPRWREPNPDRFPGARTVQHASRIQRHRDVPGSEYHGTDGSRRGRLPQHRIRALLARSVEVGLHRRRPVQHRQGRGYSGGPLPVERLCAGAAGAHRPYPGRYAEPSSPRSSGDDEPGRGLTKKATSWAFTQSLVSGFGSGVVAADTGILLNNGHRFGFLLDSDHINALAPGVHAKGVMTPTIIMREGQPLAGLGSSGGYTIPQTVGLAIAQMLMYGMDIQKAVTLPRIVLNRPAGPVPVGPDVRDLRRSRLSRGRARRTERARTRSDRSGEHGGRAGRVHRPVDGDAGRRLRSPACRPDHRLVSERGGKAA